jgi:uncharacterized delta-60 repeat protein
MQNPELPIRTQGKTFHSPYKLLNKVWSMQTKIFFMLMVSLLWVCQVANAQVQLPAGTLDPSFGNQGRVAIHPLHTCKLSAIATQPDGKIVAAGNAGGQTNSYNLAIMRLNRDGTPDLSFAGSGFVRTEFPGTNPTIQIQQDGKILVTTQDVWYRKPSANFIILRFNADGSQDKGFGTNGMVTLDFSPSNDFNQTAQDFCEATALQADGKIIVAGQTSRGSLMPNFPFYNFALARLNSDGTLDKTFNNNGLLVTEVPGIDETLSAIALQSDGKIVAAGINVYDINANVLLRRYHSDGSLDTFFGTNGRVDTDFGSFDEVRALLVQPDGKLVAVGTKKPNILAPFESDIFIGRYTPDGSLAESFGQAGKVITDLGQYEEMYGATLQENGKLVVAGTSGIGHPTRSYSLTDFLAIRYNTDGTFDKDFGDNGKISTDFGRVEVARALAIDKDGNVILAGYTGEWTFDGFDQSDFAFARYIGVPPKPLPDFALSTGATIINAARGSKVKLSIQIDHLNGFTGSITVRAPDTSNLKIVIPEPVQTTTSTSVDFKLKVKKGTPAGNHQLVFTGKDDSGKEHSATITIVIE